VHHPSADPDEIVIDDGAMQPHARATRTGHAETRFPALHKCLPRRDCLEVPPSPCARSRPNPRVGTSSSTFPPSHYPQPQPRPASAPQQQTFDPEWLATMRVPMSRRSSRGCTRTSRDGLRVVGE